MASNLARFRPWVKGTVEAIWHPRRMEITVQRDQFLIIKRQSKRGWCRDCGSYVEMVNSAEAEAITGIAGKAFTDANSTQTWHFVAKNEQLICLQSLWKSIEVGPSQKKPNEEKTFKRML